MIVHFVQRRVTRRPVQIGKIVILSIVLCIGSPAFAAGSFIANLVATPNPNYGSFSLSWSRSASGTYNVQQRIGGGAWVTLGATYSSSFAISGRSPGTYEYRLDDWQQTCTIRRGDDFCVTTHDYSETISVTVNPPLPVTPGPAEGAVGAVGSTPYGIDVGTDGDTAINVPLRLIPGVAGFAPSLSLEYDSGRGIDRLEQSLPEDALGYGWRLAGLSHIRRCVVGQSSGSSINLTNSDSLCLDGMPLVLASGTHFSVGAIYRTLIESYAKIEIKGASGALWFQVTLPDGTVQEYGNGVGSRVDKNGGTDYQWSISKATSTDNNVINYTWYHDAIGGINFIRNINYAGADADFEYFARTDAASVFIGTASQTQSVFLHTVRVKYNGKKIREYRLLDEVVSSRRRLNKIQLCGYNEGGTAVSCLAPLDFDWLTPTSTMAGVDILVDGMTDSLHAVHQIEYGTITGSSHPFLFTERPFGNGVLPANTQLLSGSGALRHVATKLRRDNGLGGFHDTSYAYQNKGLKSTKRWGFLGFYAQRIKDEQSGIVTYLQYRMDYPYFGQLARLWQYDGVYPSHTQTLTRSESDFAQQSISHGAGTSVLPYASSMIDFIYEGTTQLGASKTTNALTFSSGFVSQVVTTSQSGTGVSTGSPGSTWGDIPSYTLSGLMNTTQSTIAFTNRTTSGKWLINFPHAVTNKSWPGAASGTGIVQDVSLSPHSNSLRPTTVTKYPNDASLTLATVLGYDTSGRTTSVTISGDNVASRVTSVPSFKDDRYPAQVVNAKGHAEVFDEYDSRFGTVKSFSNPNNSTNSVIRDPFGRVTSSTNGDGVVTTTTYTDCPTGCGISVYGVAPNHYMRTDSPVTPIRNTYFDSLGRIIRTETEPFAGSSYSKVDTKYDTQGRVEKTSLPYSNGTRKDVLVTYDIRNRVSNVARPDGSSTATVFNASGNKALMTVTDHVKNADGSSAGAQVKRNEYNILGQLTKTTDGYGTTTNPSTTYSYDANGNILTVTVNGGSSGSTTTTFEYDAAGNQKKIVGPNIGTVTSTYTGLGELKTQLDNKGQLFTHSYDVLGRPVSIVGPDGTSSWVWDTAPNGVGRLKSRNSAGFSESYSYDSLGRLRTILTGISPIGGSGSTYYSTEHTYDTYGRPSTTTYPGGFILTRAYNARGYLAELRNGATAIQTINNLDAFGNSIDESYGNGVNTLRTFDPETGRITGVNTTKGSTVFQNNDYAWRSNGTLQSRIANPSSGLASTRKETYVYDVLNRVKLAETYINGSNTRDLSYAYNQLGNISSKTSTLAGDTDVTGYIYGSGTAGPHAVTSASIDGVAHTLTYDLNGAVTKYDIAGTSNDKYIAYNAYNQPTKIVVGDSLTDSTPVAKDEFAYGPNGQRFARKSTWQDGANTITEHVSYVGDVEVISDDSNPSIQTITKVRLSSNVTHVTIVGSTTETFFEYAHRDHLGSIEVVTDENGVRLDSLAFEPFGSRKRMDWTANITSAEITALLVLDWDHPRKVRGFTGHEHLDRTGFVHMNGRVYDPVLGRFLSPDPIVQFPAFSQSWNRYSYVSNAPTSFTDPSGFAMDEIKVKGRKRRGAGLGIGGSIGIGGIGAGGPNGGEFGGRGARDSAMEEIVVTGTRIFFGEGGGYTFVGLFGSYSRFGVFDDFGNAGIVAVRQSRQSSSGDRGVGGNTSAVAGGANSSSPSSDAIEIANTLVFGTNLGIMAGGYFDGILPGFWRGANGKWNSLSWGGNRWTGARSNVTFHTRHLRIIAKGTLVLDVGFEAADFYTAVSSGNKIEVLDSTVDFGAIAVGLSGNPYAAWGAVWYGLTDATFGPWAAGWVAHGICRLDPGCL